MNATSNATSAGADLYNRIRPRVQAWREAGYPGVTGTTLRLLQHWRDPGYDRLHFERPRTFLTPLDLGGLGFAFPVALGAKLGRPEAPVLAIHGDGGFLMNAQEIETAVRHGINVVTVVMNNNCWGSEKAYQKHFYGERYIGCDIGNPRYDQSASRRASASD